MSRRCKSPYVIRVRNATVALSAHRYCGLPSPRFGSVAGLFTSVAAPSISATVYRYYFSVFTTRNTANPSRFGGIKAVNGSILYQVVGLDRLSFYSLRLRLLLLRLRSIVFLLAYLPLEIRLIHLGLAESRRSTALSFIQSSAWIGCVSN